MSTIFTTTLLASHGPAADVCVPALRSTVRTWAALALLAAAVPAQTIERVSVSSGGAQGNGASGEYGISVSADGRYVVFASNAANLAANDTNSWMDVFLHDRQTGATTLVSASSGGVAGNDVSNYPSISADGRFVAYESRATNLAPGTDNNGQPDVLLHDTSSGSTFRISVSSTFAQADFGGGLPQISADGLAVAFVSQATNLVPGDTNGLADVFVRQGTTTERVSVSTAGVQSNGFCTSPSISADGRYVVFTSLASNLVLGDTNGVYDVFLRDRVLGTTARVSVSTGGGQGDDFSDQSSISADGRYVAFMSRATNLVAFDTNFIHDIFLRDRLTGTTERVSLSTCGTPGNGMSALPILSGDARFVAFFSYSQFVPGDIGPEDGFVRDLRGGTTDRVSTNAGISGNDTSMPRAISPDGRYVAFLSRATNLVAGDTNGVMDVFVCDRGDASVSTPTCAGDGSVAACPCNNSGTTGHGCENSSATSGAALLATGNARLSADTLRLTTACEKPTAFSIVLQGSAAIAPTSYGDGLRCAGGSLKRLYAVNAVDGSVMVPLSGHPSISARSAALGDSITPGTTRVYQVYYRDASVGFCAAGGTFNVSSGAVVTWQN